MGRDVTGEQLVRHLVRSWGYKVERQQGSHIILTTDTPIRHRLSVPNHKPLALGTFRALCTQVCLTKKSTMEELLDGL